MGYLDELRAFVSENAPDEALTKLTEPGFVGSVSNPLVHISPQPAALLREWHANLSKIDQFVTPPAWSLDDWLKLTDTAFWLYEGHASYAVRHGWTALDLFGIRPSFPQRGGLADLLDGARNLKLSGGKAYWSRFGAPFNIGVGIGQGCVPLWELD